MIDFRFQLFAGGFPLRNTNYAYSPRPEAVLTTVLTRLRRPYAAALTHIHAYIHAQMHTHARTHASHTHTHTHMHTNRLDRQTARERETDRQAARERETDRQIGR